MPVLLGKHVNATVQASVQLVTSHAENITVPKYVLVEPRHQHLQVELIRTVVPVKKKN